MLQVRLRVGKGLNKANRILLIISKEKPHSDSEIMILTNIPESEVGSSSDFVNTTVVLDSTISYAICINAVLKYILLPI